MRPLFLCVPLLFVACASEPEGATDLGEEVFKDYCVSCHGGLGDAQISGAKDLTVSVLDKEQIQNMVLKGRKLMRPYEGVLSSEEIEAVSAYVLALRTE